MSQNHNLGNGNYKNDSKIKLKKYLIVLPGIAAAAIFFSMLAKPDLFALFMGAKQSDLTASTNTSTQSLVRVAAGLSPSPVIPSPTYVIPSPTPFPTVSVYISPTPWLSITVAPTGPAPTGSTQILQSRLEANLDQGGIISDWNFDVYYNCFGTNGYPSASGSYRYKAIGTVEHVAYVPFDSSCKLRIMRLPTANEGYSWSDPNFQTSTRYENAVTRNQYKYQTTFLDLRLKKSSVVSPPVTVTPTKTPVPSPVSTYNLTPQTPFVPGGTGRIQLTKLAMPSAIPTGSQIYRVLSSSFTGLVPTRQYEVYMCNTVMCTANTGARMTADANGNASTNSSYDITTTMPALTIQLRQTLLFVGNPPSCRDTACMLANL